MIKRLALDIGTNSIGWCLIDPNSDAILDAGVRIFPDSRDPQSGTSLAVDRRVARGMRRNRDRRLKRQDRLMGLLIAHGLMPDNIAARKALEGLDPYELRARGLDEALGPHEVGRALFHLAQRRGFKSNRKTDAGDKETSEYKARMSELARRIAESGSRTLGEYLHRRHAKKKPVRGRPGVGIAPTREMLAVEFEKLWNAQSPHHPSLTEDARAEIEEAIFLQRPLHEKIPGRCELESDELRAPRALPLTHRFRIYQELNNLRVIQADRTERRLTMEQRDALATKLLRQKSMSLGAIRKQLDLDASDRLNFEDGKRTKLIGDETSATLAAKDLFGKAWWNLDETVQDDIASFLLDEEEESAVIDKAIADWRRDAETGKRLAAARLAPGYGRLGRSAMAKLVEVMRDQGLGYAEAATEIYGDHRTATGDGSASSLPYYGKALSHHTTGGTGDPADDDEKRFGPLPNPTAHVALNQLRRVVNAIVREHGKPDEIVVELARDMKRSWADRQETQRNQAANQRRNETIAREIEALSQTVTGENIRRWKLWEELGDVHERKCPYSGAIISPRMLFTDEVEIDHILPFSRTLDDSMANRILATRDANRRKRNRSPFEAFEHETGAYAYDAILARAANLPRNKQWRFAPDAMERYDRDNAFIARQLTDTAYATRLARQYLTEICPPNKVWAVPGRLTALLRGKWGLNSILGDSNLKERVDHRHHAIDAAVAAVTDRGLLQRLARANEHERDRIMVPEPWENFREELRDRVTALTVSHKPDHGIGGKLHEETAYGPVADPDAEDGFNLVYSKGFGDLNDKEVKRIRDKTLRDAVARHLYEAGAAGVAHKKAMADFPLTDEDRARWPKGVSRVRLLKKEAATVPIRDKTGRVYKAYSPGDNHHVDIWELPDGKWTGVGVTVFEANQDPRISEAKKPHPAARRVMRVHKGDLMKLERDGLEKIYRVAQLAPKNGRFVLAGHEDSGNLQKRHDDKDDSFRWVFESFGNLLKDSARLVRVDALGRVRDPGPSRPEAT